MTTSGVAQEEVLRFLASPASNDGRHVKRIDTHAASVFLSGSRVLKVKRAVKFPFLDYSTLELRKQACLAELEVNRRFAPQIYVGLCRITREGGRFVIGGEGEVVEWAVEMRRFDEDLTLDNYVKENEITFDIANTLAKSLAEAHHNAQRMEANTWIAALQLFLRQHNKVFVRYPELFEPSQAAKLFHTSKEVLANSEELISSRCEAGLLIRGHGDLHLGNIALIQSAPVIFDAIEFDPLIAAGDVFYDLAFLIMDLIFHSQHGAANAVLNSYIQLSKRNGNIEGLRLLPLFLSIRSAIRAVVAVSRFDQTKKVDDANLAKRYFDAAIGFLKPVSPKLIAIGGFSGTGKSHLARLIAPYVQPEPGALIVRSDVKRKVLFGVDETTRLDAAAYSKQASEIVYYSLFVDAWKALAAGHSVILDAVFGDPDERVAAEQLAFEANVKFKGLFLRADLATRIERIEGRVGDASDADRRVAQAQEVHLNQCTSWASVDSSGELEATLQAALSWVEPTAILKPLVTVEFANQ